MTAKWYVHDILQPYELPLVQRLLGAIFQQNNVLPYTARVSQDYFHAVTILPWPTRSQICLQSSMSGIICDGVLGESPTSLNELEAKLQQIWNKMSQDIIQNLYAALIPDRIASCIRARGGLTGY
ncbi:transposable element Tcb1 transposase [Trichonephila clavipes]|nr:transposable element Tcb1 transposase [Trichonephila clavipes]